MYEHCGHAKRRRTLELNEDIDEFFRKKVSAVDEI
jgi:hypothetical protein